MTFSMSIYIMLPLILLVTAGWLLTRPLAAESVLHEGDLSKGLELMRARHARHFPQLRLVLSEADEAFIARRLPRRNAARVRRERRRILVNYVRGIAEDFARLDHLSRLVASLSPELRRQDEFQRVVLEVRFRASYRLAMIRLSAGGKASAAGLQQLTELIAGLSKLAHDGMEALENRIPAAQPSN